MANQIIVTNTGNVQVAIEPTPNVQVQISRAAINTLTNVPNANYANFAGEAFDVNVSNVSGIGNIAVINLDGNLSNILYGNGIFAAVPNVSNVANANFANFAGNAFNVTGANVSGAVAFATTANAVAGANVSGQVANALVAGTVTTAAQPNITSVGTLNGLTSNANITAPFFIGNIVGNISGNITVPGTNTSVLFNQAGNAGASDAFQFNYATNVATITGTLSATNISGNGSQLTNINGANVSGAVAFATTANAVAGANVSGAVAFATTANSVAGANVSGEVAFAATANSVAGANVSGQVANALVAGTVYTNAQPNITSVGTLAGLQVSGNITPNSNIAYDIGNTTNRFKDLYLSGSTIYLGGANITASGNSLVTNGSNVNGDLNVTGNATVNGDLNVTGNLSYINVVNLRVQDPLIEQGGGPNGAPLTTNDGMDRGQILQYFTTAPVSAYMGWKNNQNEFEFGSNVSISNNVVTVNTFGNVRANVFIGDLQGTANFATVANSVAAANVSGLGNIATTNYDGNGSNVLYGNGGFYALPIISNVANANFANFAGEAFNVSGSNVTGAVGLATFATTANAVAGANVVGEVANANYATFSGTSFSVSGANVSGFVGNATHATISDSSNGVSGSNVVGQVGNALIAGTVYTNAQPNITSVGTLTSLAVTGNITSFANIAGDYFIGNGALLTGVGDFSAALGYHGSFFSNVSQTIASTTTAYPITLNNTSAGTYGIAVTSNSRVTMTYAGTYNIQYSLQFTNTDNQIHNATVWLRKNGTDVPDTNSVYAVTGSHGGGNGQLIGAINYIVDALANDYYELIWQAESTQVSLEYIPPGTTPTSPATPSAIVTAMQVTNVQAATLSGNLTGNLIGNSYGLTGTSFINIIGNISGNVFTGNANGLTGIVGGNVTGFVANASHANISDVANVAYSVSGANVTGIVGNATHATVSDSSNSVTGGNVIGAVGLATFATTANAVAGANVSGAVAFATTANSVAVANVSGIGNIATVNLDGSGSNVLYGNGVFATITIPSGTSISNGTSNVNIPAVNGNVNTSVGGVSNVMVVTSTGANVNGTITANTFTSNVITGTAPFTVTSTTQVANLNVASAGLATFATTANAVAVANVSGIGNIAVVNLTGSSSNVLYGNGVFAAVSGGSGTPGGANTELQYNNNGAFGGISTVTWNGSNISLGAIGNVKITGGSNNYILATDGTGNLSFSTKTNNLTIGTRTISVNIPITDYTMNVQGRTGNIVVNVN